MKKLIALALVLGLLASMAGVASAVTYTCEHGTGPLRVAKNLPVEVTIDSAICLWLEKDALNLGNLNPCDSQQSHGQDSTKIYVDSNRGYKKDIIPGDLTGLATGAVIDKGRLSLDMDGNDIRTGAGGWYEDPAGSQKYYSPDHPAGYDYVGETLTVDLDVNWTDKPDTYNGTVEVSAEQI